MIRIKADFLGLLLTKDIRIFTCALPTNLFFSNGSKRTKGSREEQASRCLMEIPFETYAIGGSSEKMNDQ